jgi:hypothetical protein
MKTLWCDMKTTEAKIAFLRSGEAWASGAISIEMANEFADALERIRMLEEDLAEYITLYSDWKAYATNLESAGQRMLECGYHSPHVVSAWTKAKETRP